MPLYTPSSGNNVNFELKPYISPSGDSVNFELVPAGIEVETLKAIISYPNVTLKGKLTGLDSGESAYVWFEYREIGSETWNTTEQQTLYEDGEFSETLTLEGDYEYRAVAQKTESGSSEVRGNIVNFYVNTYSETLGLSEVSNYRVSLFKEEPISLLETYKATKILYAILEDALILSDLTKFSFHYSKEESISLKEEKKFKYLTFFAEKITFSDLSKKIGKDPLNYWIIAKPLNSNFAFDIDSNNDGLTDGWECSTTNTELIKDATKLSVQEVELFSNDYLKMNYTLNGKYLILFEIKPLFRVNFNIKKEDDLIYHYRFDPLDEWRLFNVVLNFNGNYTFEFIADDYSFFYLDNFAIIDYRDYLKVVEHKRYAPSGFRYRVSGDEIIEAFEEDFSNKKIEKDFNIDFDYMDYHYEQYLNSLIGQKILVKTNLDEVFAFLILGLNKNYKPNKQGINQTYITRLLVKEV